MRIISGIARGRKLLAPGSRFGNTIRPTADRAREALFSIIGDEVVDARVLDLFAGSGAIGLEALSRGARTALFVDVNPRVVELIRSNIEKCGFSDNSLVLCRDLTKGLSFFHTLKPRPYFEFVFLDPPYGKGMARMVLQELEKTDICTAGCLIIAEDESRAHLPENAGRLSLVDQRRYGEAGFWFYRLDRGDEG